MVDDIDLPKDKRCKSDRKYNDKKVFENNLLAELG